MTEVQLPFLPDLEKWCIDLRKTCTTRLEKKAKPGDTFTLQGFAHFEVVHVAKMPLRVVYLSLYRAEGFGRPFLFQRYWNQIPNYPELEKIYDEEVYVHFFTRTDRTYNMGIIIR